MGVISGTLIGGLIAGLAKEIGAPLVEKIVARRLGPVGGELAGQVIRTIAEKAGVEPDRLPNLAESDLPRLEKAIVETEAETPELVAAWTESQKLAIDLQRAEMEQGPTWTWAWRPGWMWFFAFLWAWALVASPMINALWMLGLPSIDLAILLSLNGLYMALYMGGHTVKAWIGRKA